MKIAWRNFLLTLRRYKTASLLNIAGLTLAFTAFYVLLVQVCWEATFNRGIDACGRIYLVSPCDEDSGRYETNTPRPDSEALIASSPEIEAGGSIRIWYNPLPVWLRRGDSGAQPFRLSLNSVSAGFVRTVGMRATEGDLEALARPGTVAIARSQAERLGVGAGATVWIGSPEEDDARPEEPLEVVAVYADFPANSSFARVEAIRDVGDRDLTAHNNWNDCYFVRLRAGADPQTIARRWERIHADNYRAWASGMLPVWKELWGEDAVSGEDAEDFCACRLIALGDLYFDARLEDNGAWDRGSLATTLTLLGIAVLVIAIALINFINFFLALVPVRLRTVTIFKVYGAPTAALRFNFVFEAVGFVLCALAAAWYLAFALQHTRLASYLAASLAPGDQLPVAGLVAAVAIVAAVVAGIYPAWYITSFRPALASRGASAGSPAARRLRTALVCVQFLVSTGLLIATGCCYAQYRFMRRFDMGFDRSHVLTFEVSDRTAADYDAFVSRLESDPRVVGVTASASPFVLDAFSVWGREWKGREIPELHVRFVRSNFLRVMRIPLLEGEGFLPRYDRDTLQRIIFTQLAHRMYDIRVGERFDGIPVAGICADFHFRPLQLATRPFAFLTDAMPMGVFYLRIAADADADAVCAHIRRVIRETDPAGELPEIRFMEEQIGDLYRREERLATIIALFALLSVAIALMGVFGIVLFETQHRRREIAVRKVMGATRGEILALVNRRYALLASACFVAAVPPSLWAVERWLRTFAFRVPLRGWFFALALLAILAITLFTVSIRSWRAASENPADALKSD